MKSRYTVKKYNPEVKINDEQIAQLKEILHLSPSSINSQPWNFVFVSDPETKQRLAEVSYFNKEKVLESSHVIVFRALRSPEDFERQIEENLPEGSIHYYKTFVKPKGEAEIKAWMKHQVYLSLGVLLAACAEMGIDSTPMEGIENDKYDTILGSEKYVSLFAVTIGERSESDKNQPVHTPKKRLERQKVILEI